jgi:hypothetical protein
MVSYSVIVGSSLMTLSQPAVMIFRTWESENWSFEEPERGLVDGADAVEAARVLIGLACGARKVVGRVQSDMDQPRSCQ